MPRIHVCSLALVEPTAKATGAKRLVTLLNPKTGHFRPVTIAEEHHLVLDMSDIVEPQDGLIAPEAKHVRALLAFARGWDRQEPMIVHCYAGVSRSTAAAFIIACALNEARAEHDVASAIRRSSPTATPNRRLVALADRELKRSGRMLDAIDAIGRGVDCEEGVPFTLELA